jgi:predicted nucleic acid-binding protein
VTKQESHVNAAAFLKQLRRAGAQVFYPKVGAQESICELAHDLKVTRNSIFDLQIAWIARDAGAKEIWTHDQGFIKLPGLKVVDPL